MSVEVLLERIPSYAKDLKLNLQSVLRQNELTEQQLWGTAVASAVASRNPEALTAILDDARHHLSPEALEAAKSAAAIMGMNNVYYRFLHLTCNEKYPTISARLRMNAISDARGRSCGFRTVVRGRVGDQQLPGLRGFSREGGA